MACSRLSLLRLPVAQLRLRSLSLASPRLAEQITHTGQQWADDVCPSLPPSPYSRRSSLTPFRLSSADPSCLHMCPQDLRQVRFAVTGTEKQVNTQWAIDLIAAVPPKKVHARVVRCLFFLPL